MYFLETSLVIEWQVWHKVSASHVNYGAFSEHVQDFIILYMELHQLCLPLGLAIKIQRLKSIYVLTRVFGLTWLFYNNTILRMSTITMFEYWGEVSLGGLALTSRASAKVIHISLSKKNYFFLKKINLIDFKITILGKARKYTPYIFVKYAGTFWKIIFNVFICITDGLGELTDFELEQDIAFSWFFSFNNMYI